MFVVVAAHEFLRGDAGSPRIDFDGGAMGVIGAHIHSVLPSHFEKAHVDIGHDVFHQVAQMNAAIGVGKRASDENRISHDWYPMQNRDIVPTTHVR